GMGRGRQRREANRDRAWRSGRERTPPVRSRAVDHEWFRGLSSARGHRRWRRRRVGERDAGGVLDSGCAAREPAIEEYEMRSIKRHSMAIAIVVLCAAASARSAIAQETINYATVSGRVT